MNKAFWYIIFLFIGLFAVYSTLCYFGTKELDINTTKTINAPSLMIYNQVNDFANWNNWSSWANVDTSLHTEIGEVKEGTGAIYKWFTKKTGGQISIEESIKASSIKTKFTSTRNKNINYQEWNIKSLTDKKSEVNIHFYGEKEIPFFIRGYRLITGVKHSITRGLDNDLDNIEKLVVKQAKDNFYGGYTVKTSESKERYFLINRDNVEKEKVQQFYTQNLGSLFQALQKNKIEMDGMPSGLYFNRNTEKYDLAAAIPVNQELSFDGVSSYTIPAGKTLVVDYLGDHTDIEKAHSAISHYMKDHNIYTNPPVIETYITDPAKDKNPKNWLTRVTYYYSH